MFIILATANHALQTCGSIEFGGSPSENIKNSNGILKLKNFERNASFKQGINRCNNGFKI